MRLVGAWAAHAHIWENGSPLFGRVSYRRQAAAPASGAVHGLHFGIGQTRNLAIADRLQEIAQEKHCTAAQLALAWLLRRHPDVIPIPGTSSVARLEENCAAADIALSEEELSRIETALPKGSVEGDRYAPEMMKNLNG